MTDVSQVILHVSAKKLLAHVPKKYKLEISLPENLKDEAVRARFNKKKFSLTLKIPKLEIFEPENIEEIDAGFMENLQKGLNVKKS